MEISIGKNYLPVREGNYIQGAKLWLWIRQEPAVAYGEKIRPEVSSFHEYEYLFVQSSVLTLISLPWSGTETLDLGGSRWLSVYCLV